MAVAFHSDVGYEPARNSRAAYLRPIALLEGARSVCGGPGKSAEMAWGKCGALDMTAVAVRNTNTRGAYDREKVFPPTRSKDSGVRRRVT